MNTKLCGVGAMALLISVFASGDLFAQVQVADDAVKGKPPLPGEEKPVPLEVRKDITPQIPPQFDKPRPNTHTVRAGDTLFDISRYYFGTPYVWPVVWSFNDHITNPHWIYPGDIVYLRAPLPGDAPYDADGISAFPGNPEGLSVALAGYYLDRENEEFEPVGVLANSPEAKSMLAFPDKVYIDLKDSERQSSKKGQVYAVLRFAKDVVDDEDDKVLARKFEVVGAVRVIEKGEGDNMDTAVIVQSWKEIFRGDVLFPYERQLLRVPPAVATNTVVGNVVDTLRVETLFGAQHYVFLNRGKNQGVRKGNRFFVYDRQDGYSDLDIDDVSKLPYERIAQIRVIHTEDDYSTGIVTESKYELDLGMRVEMYKGY